MRLELGQIKWLLVERNPNYLPRVGEVRRVYAFQQPLDTICLGSWEIKRVYPKSSLVLLVPGKGGKRRFSLKAEKIRAIGFVGKALGEQEVKIARSFGEVFAGEFVAEPNGTGGILRRRWFDIFKELNGGGFDGN